MAARLGETPGQGCYILQESWSILSRDTWWNGFFGGCFQRLGTPFFSCNLKPLFKQNEDISSCFTWPNPHEFLEPFSSLGQGYLRATIFNEEKALGTRLVRRSPPPFLIWESSHPFPRFLVYSGPKCLRENWETYCFKQQKNCSKSGPCSQK